MGRELSEEVEENWLKLHDKPHENALLNLAQSNPLPCIITLCDNTQSIALIPEIILG